MYLVDMYLVDFSSFSSLQIATFVFDLLSEKKSSNLKISIYFGRALYLNELSYHTLIGRI